MKGTKETLLKPTTNGFKGESIIETVKMSSLKKKLI